MSGNDQMPMRRGKKWTRLQRLRPWGGDQTGCPLYVHFSSVTNRHVSQERSKKWHKGTGQNFHLSPWPTTRLRRPRPRSINTLSLTWPAQSKMKANNSLEAALGRAVGCAPWLITGWEEGRQNSAWNPSKSPIPCDCHLTRESASVLSKTAPTPRTQKFSRLWLCIWRGTRETLWPDWDDLWLRKSSKIEQQKSVNWQKNNMSTTLCPCVKRKSFFSLPGSLGVMREPWNRRRPDALAGWPLHLSIT